VYRRDCGADTLTRMAVRAVVANRRGLDGAVLGGVPWRGVGDAVWRELRRRYVRSTLLFCSFTALWVYALDSS
jgi:hypothetical protein